MLVLQSSSLFSPPTPIEVRVGCDYVLGNAGGDMKHNLAAIQEIHGVICSGCVESRRKEFNDAVLAKIYGECNRGFEGRRRNDGWDDKKHCDGRGRLLKTFSKSQFTIFEITY